MNAFTLSSPTTTSSQGTPSGPDHMKESDFELLRVIGGGEGSFSRVYKVKKKGTDSGNDCLLNSVY